MSLHGFSLYIIRLFVNFTCKMVNIYWKIKWNIRLALLQFAHIVRELTVSQLTGFPIFHDQNYSTVNDTVCSSVQLNVDWSFSEGHRTPYARQFSTILSYKKKTNWQKLKETNMIDVPFTHRHEDTSGYLIW